MPQPTMTAGPGADRPVDPDDSDLSIINAIRQYKNEAESASRTRMKQNRVNRNAYMGIQDWSHKNPGQSTEFLPKTAMAAEQFVATFKKALVQADDWYEPKLTADSQSPLGSLQIRDLMNQYLSRIVTEDYVEDKFASQVANWVKMGCFDSLMILKMSGVEFPRRKSIDPKKKTEHEWRIRAEIVRSEDYYPDPTGRGLYEIHSAERDRHYVQERAEQGIYDLAAVKRLLDTDQDEDRRKERSERDERRPQELGQDEIDKPSFRKKVVIDEFWGTLLNADGEIIHENAFCAVANDTFLIRKPKPNPLWHGHSPFFAVPLVKVPFSVWHKALYDHATQLNLAANELFNLILDGGLASVWGVRQVRVNELEDPNDISSGIPQGKTLAVKSTLPPGAKVVEQVTEGQVPQDAMAAFSTVDAEFNVAALTNDLKLGGLPGRKPLATEVIEVEQSQGGTVDSVVKDVEGHVERLLKDAWLLICQHRNLIPTQVLVESLGEQGAFAFMELSDEQLFEIFNTGCTFEVRGISNSLQRVREFQKMGALLQIAGPGNPVLMQAFFSKYAPTRVLDHMIKTLQINPRQWERDEKDLARMPQEVAEIAALSQAAGGGTGQNGLSAEQSGEPGLPAEVNQLAQPLTGLTANS